MADYRVYYFDGDSRRIGRGEWIEAENDAAAAAFIRDKKLPVRSEIWQQDRLIAEIPAYRKP